jgi:hypothetical protein
MANAAAKKQAASNIEQLKLLHTAFAVVNALFLLSHFLLSRPRSIKPYLLFSLPAFFLQYQLERIARPKYDSKGSLIAAGEDLAQKGLTEWFQDVLYVTWGCVILVIITGSNKCFYLYLSIPIYASYMVYTTFIKGRTSSAPEEEPTGQTQSKRQAKKERKNKNVRYVHG